MKILLSNHQLGSFAGTEIFTYTLACSLKSKGHEVQVYSAYLGEISQLFLKKGIPVVDELKYLSDDFDIAHVHHNINAYEIRNHFPNLPMVFVSHGVTPQLEQPPFINLGICKYVAISEEVQKNLKRYGITDEKISIVRNPIDETRYFPRTEIHLQPKNALVISNKIDIVTENTIKLACSELGISYRFVGQRFEYVPNEQLPEIINQHDIVFTLGRGVAESMLCGRVPIVMDVGVGDGLVTPENCAELMRWNFSGRMHRRIFTKDELVQEIKKYHQDYGEQLKQIALEEFSASRQTEKLISFYKDCLPQEKNHRCHNRIRSYLLSSVR